LSALRIGVLGGTFDPPHAGHLIVAQDVVEGLELNELLFMPCHVPPHRDLHGVSPAALRFRMVQAAVEPNDRLRASDLELQREGPSYTVDTVRMLKDAYPGADLFVVIGADQFENLHTWKAPDALASMARLVVMAREGEDPRRIDPGVKVSYDCVPVTRVDLSSSAIRERVRQGRSIRYLVRKPVRRIIAQEGLYRD
jgi:nicotinate-nucleotide adenylyltransferase